MNKAKRIARQRRTTQIIQGGKIDIEKTTKAKPSKEGSNNYYKRIDNLLSTAAEINQLSRNNDALFLSRNHREQLIRRSKAD